MRLLATLALAALALAVPRAAEACSCSLPIADASLLPADGAVDVPLDVHFYLGEHLGACGEEVCDEPRRTLALFGPDGRVPLVRSQLGLLRPEGAALEVFRPEAHLAPRTTYRLESPDGPSFTTGDGLAPAVERPPRIVRRIPFLVSSDEGGTCGPEAGVELELELAPGTAVVVADRGHSRRWVDGPGGFFDDVTTEAKVTLGYHLCLESWPQAREGACTELRLGAYDLAGHFSGWTDRTEVCVTAGVGDPVLRGTPDGAPPRSRPSGGGHTPPGSASPAPAHLTPLALLRRRAR